jgi:hypothetical protein
VNIEDDLIPQVGQGALQRVDHHIVVAALGDIRAIDGRQL